MASFLRKACLSTAATATMNSSSPSSLKALISSSPNPRIAPRPAIRPLPPPQPLLSPLLSRHRPVLRPGLFRAMAVDSEYSSRRRSSSEPKETILLPGCDYNHWLIVMEFHKDLALTREQMIETYLSTLATVLGSALYLKSLKRNSRDCLVFYGYPPDYYIDVKNKDHGGDKYINGEIIPCTYPTYQPKQRSGSKYQSTSMRDGGMVLHLNAEVQAEKLLGRS